MGFAIFYNRADVTPIAAEFTRADLSNADKQFALACWNAGLSGWSTAPLAPVDRNSGDPDCRIVVVSGSNKGTTITLAMFRDFLYRQSSLPGGAYLAALADDMGGVSGAVEPWPVP